MSKSFIRCLATALSIAALGSAMAAPAASEVVEVKAAPLRMVFSWEAERVVGEYLLSDGRSMTIRQRGLVVVAHIDGEDEVRLRATNAMNMRDTDGRLALRFDTDSEPNAVLVTVTLYPATGEPVQVAALPRRLQ